MSALCPYCQKNFDSVGLWQDKPQHNWADRARITVVALREQLAQTFGSVENFQAYCEAKNAPVMLERHAARKHAEESNAPGT